MKDLKVKLIVGVSGIITIGALGGMIAFGNVNAANHGNYKNQTKTRSILADVSDLTTNELGILEVDANGDGVTDIYSDFGSFKTAMELTAEQVDANTENIAAESDIYSSAKTYSVGELCIKDGEIYSCTSEITSGEDWDESHWEKASVTTAVNTINDSLETVTNNLTVAGTPFRFGKDADGNYGYIITDEAGADSVIPFSSGINLSAISKYNMSGRGTMYSYTFAHSYTMTSDGVVILSCFQTPWTSGTVGSWKIYVNDDLILNYNINLNSYAIKTFEVHKNDIVKIVGGSGEAICSEYSILYP